MKITVETVVNAPLARVWQAYTTPEDIVHWNAASDDWHTPRASVDLRVGGQFSSRMEARDGSMGFDFAGTYTRVEPHRLIEYAFGDRNARVEFSESPAGVGVRVIFDAESTHSTEQQQAGWQAILDNFRRHVEGAARINPFCWYELMTTDAPAALDYYRRVIGWNTKPAGMGPVPYTLLSVGEAAIGGVFELTPDMCSQGARPAWIGYIAVDDVDAHAARVKAAGGAIHVGPMDLPEVGRFATVADPHGAPFVLFKPLSTESMPVPPPGTPGGMGWRELHAGNGAEAWEFYSGLFGWTKAEAMDMGPMGIYQLFATGGAPVGGMMTRMPDSPGAFWLYYVDVEAIDAAAARAVEAGGKILMGPHEVPGPMYVVQCIDPQGAVFAMVAPKR